MSFTPFGKGFNISLSDLQNEMNRMLDRAWHAGISTGPLDGQGWAPVIDLIDEGDRYIVTAEVPGLSVADIEVSFEHGELILKGSKLPERGDEELEYIRNERRFGSFCRRVAVPEEINAEAISASCQRGLLEIILPKFEVSSGKKIKIDVVDG